MSWYYWVILCVIGIIVIAYLSYVAKEKRLLKKYNDPVLVERLMKGEIWQGQTRRELLDSQGKPSDVSEQVLKTKVKRIYKFHKTAKNRYDLKVTVENGIVVGWDKK
ncbi:DUF2845 domain-containing protein [Aquimarina brevivitae]|uniref:DUF2845 domain-containing protein n=1 Tax=Aquimarina brevivitae TaxID=323412 RepID=A0A4Q7NTX5_9FLAO|nr:DUF2845 domain-containing protein [Aquimarina brevivitae]RZS90623.1 hypothetical protein EV197_3151 [Aquimarina brevivitae]